MSYKAPYKGKPKRRWGSHYDRRKWARQDAKFWAKQPKSDPWDTPRLRLPFSERYPRLHHMLVFVKLVWIMKWCIIRHYDDAWTRGMSEIKAYGCHACDFEVELVTFDGNRWHRNSL